MILRLLKAFVCDVILTILFYAGMLLLLAGMKVIGCICLATVLFIANKKAAWLSGN
jgi:hypothetical protein